MQNSAYQKLKRYIKAMQYAAVAFSGGVDSSLLTYVAHQALGGNMVAITIKTPYIPEWEIDEARLFAKAHNITHHVYAMALPEALVKNPADRCYLCKKELFTVLQNHVRTIGPHRILDGSNKDDLNDYRPGMRALQELNIASPMLQLGFTKKTIRALSRDLGLDIWDKPAYACLLSRIPYHNEITASELDRITKAEMVLRAMDIFGSRIRSHGDIARIETPASNFTRLLEPGVRARLLEEIKACGYVFVTLDLAGYQTGSLNKTLSVENRHE